MADPGLNARIKFLDYSARRFQDTAPSTSAYLMHQRNTVADEHGKALNKAQLKDICKACGSMLLPDVTCKTGVVDLSAARRKKRKLDAPESESPAKQNRLECLLCHRVTVTPLQLPQKPGLWQSAKLTGLAKQPHNPVSGNELALDVTSMKTEKPASTNASSKKRAKARKQGGLQALLERSKGMESRSSALGLDLMDFMKKT